MSLFLALLTAQAVLGAFDNLWHHEITERLPAKRSAATEVGLHATREFVYAFVFVAFAWYQWHGAWVALLAAVLGIEIIVTLADFIVEDRTRRLPAAERVLHTILAINLGLVLAAVAPTLASWWQQPTEVTPANHGIYSWLFTMFGVGVFAWSIRNAIAVLRHRRPLEWVRHPIVPGVSPSRRRVLVTGATGFVGSHLVRRLLERGDAVTVYTRDADRALDRFGPHVDVVTNLESIPADARIDAIVNLAGARILGIPWTRRRRRTLLESRLLTTRALVSLCARLIQAPRVFVSTSAIGYYGVRGDQRLDEQATPQPIFQSQLCQQWEDAATAAESLCARVVRLRFGLVFGRDGGALPSLARPVRAGLGAVIGDGRQWVSWIHIDDLVRLIEFALDKPALRGPVNAVAPHAATHLQLQHTLARAVGRKIRLRVPAFVLRTCLGEMAQLLVDGQRVVPRRALASGFTFHHPDLREALSHLLAPGAREQQADLTAMYYNGDCPVCSLEMNHYASLCANAQKSLQFIDATQRPEDFTRWGLRREHFERRVYLEDSKGRILSGLPALVELWSRMPQYRWLARIMKVPIVKPVSNALYDHALAPGLAAWARMRAARHVREASVSR
jgi:uncharacterized protein (TIGR01777 family)